MECRAAAVRVSAAIRPLHASPKGRLCMSALINEEAVNLRGHIFGGNRVANLPWITWP